MFRSAYAGVLPIQGTEVAARWDGLFLFLFWLSVFFFILVVGGMVYFAIKYRHQTGRKPKYIRGHHLLEGVWIVIPTVLLMIIFVWGWDVYHRMTQAPSDAYEIHVIARQWLWTFQYDNGKTSVGELYVPMNRPVKLIMTSQDVIHSFFVPNFRVKQDVVPGMYTSVWFEATVPGKHQIFCAEYCGTSHSGMLGKLIALSDEQWQAWYEGKKIGEIPDASEEYARVDRVSTSQASAARVKPAPPHFSPVALVEQGKNLFAQKGCLGCHSPDGTAKVGPTPKGLFGSNVPLMDGRSVVADENYIRESIEYPSAKVVKGYQPIMPSFKGLVNETEMNALIAYIKSLK